MKEGNVVPLNPETGYKIGCAMWLVCCLLGAGWLLGQGLGAISMRYFMYLLAQAGLSVGVIMDWPGVVLQGMLFGAVAYYLLYITATSQKRKLRGHLLSVWIWTLLSFLSVSLGIVSFFFGHAEKLMPVAFMFYGLISPIPSFLLPHPPSLSP